MPRRAAPRPPIDDDRRRLAAANTALIAAAVDQCPTLWPGNDREEALGVATLAYLDAVRDFDPQRGRLSTIVYYAVRNRLWNTCVRERAKRGRRAAYLRELRGRRAWTDPEPPREPADTRWLDLLDPRTRRVAELRASGLTFRQIADRIGLSPERVRQVLLEARPIVRAWLEAGGELDGS